MVCMGFAAVAVVYADYRRDKDFFRTVLDLSERVSRLEANSDDSLTLERRMSAVEAHVQVSERHEQRLAETQERVARLEEKSESEEDQDE